MDSEQFDEFLNDAVYGVREFWEKATGEVLGIYETYALNDLLTAFFSDKRPK